METTSSYTSGGSKETPENFETRKVDHLRESLSAANQALGHSGLEEIHLYHDAFPELNLDDVRLETPCLGRTLPTPFYVPGMTAGHKGAVPLNETIARVASARGWSMGVGSQRRELELDRHSQVDQWKTFRQKFPKLVLFSNIGASQLGDFKTDDFKRLVDALEAQALCVHLNALQEAMQPEGTPQFRNVLKAIEALARALPVPVVLKETGCGFSPRALEKAKSTGARAIDVSGLGGTHWGRIEGARAGEETLQAGAAKTFGAWGESVVDSVLNARKILGPDFEIWATGGVRSGLDAAKLIAMGAQRVGFAQPVLKAAVEGETALDRWMAQVEFELKVALFCTGQATTQSLRGNASVWTSKSIQNS